MAPLGLVCWMSWSEVRRCGQNRWSIRRRVQVVVNQVGADYCLCTELGNGCMHGTAGFEPSDLTSREPDSLEKLRDDMREAMASSPDAMFMDSRWVDRLTALMERGA